MPSCPPPCERELITLAKALTLIEAKGSAVRDELFAAGLVRQTPFGLRVPVRALRDWANDATAFPPVNRDGQIIPPEATPAPAGPARRGRRQ